jgi:hypothetical protein
VLDELSETVDRRLHSLKNTVELPGKQVYLLDPTWIRGQQTEFAILQMVNIYDIKLRRLLKGELCIHKSNTVVNSNRTGCTIDASANVVVCRLQMRTSSFDEQICFVMIVFEFTSTRRKG